MRFRFVADDADDRAINAAAEMRSQAEGFDALDDVLDLFVGHVGFEDDDHGEIGCLGEMGMRETASEPLASSRIR